MNNVKYQWMLYLIVFVILSTIGIQIYWNYKNYQTNKQQLINDVQVSLDNAVNNYYAHLAERSTLGFAINESYEGPDKNGSLILDSILKRIDHVDHHHTNFDSLEFELKDDLKLLKGIRHDSTVNATVRMKQIDTSFGSSRLILKDFDPNSSDSSSVIKFRNLTTQVIVSMTQDTLNLHQIDSILQNEFDRKKITVVYGLIYECPSLPAQFLNVDRVPEVAARGDNKTSVLTTVSKSSFLPNNSVLQIQFSNETRVILKRIMSGILISTLLVLAVISSLFYLLHIIKRQKQLAEVKNDLISNITHEFKTPISTIGVALESIKNFEVLEDKDKTNSYLDMSSQQLDKLNTMVEKLLETATLDSEELALKKEAVDLIELLSILVAKHQMSIGSKTLKMSTPFEELSVEVDRFHFENALNNVIDNAIKYGGDEILLSVEQANSDLITINISDNGRQLDVSNKDKIFEKFYRIPTGNTHDVKGYGIGLFYTRAIIEKHDGIIKLDLNNGTTTFKISIPK